MTKPVKSLGLSMGTQTLKPLVPIIPQQSGLEPKIVCHLSGLNFLVFVLTDCATWWVVSISHKYS